MSVRKSIISGRSSQPSAFSIQLNDLILHVFCPAGAGQSGLLRGLQVSPIKDAENIP
jgi:hypothetical protein